MDKYTIKLLSKAIRDIDEIYAYIAAQLNNQGAASDLADQIEGAIFSLETMPFRGAKRRIGAYAKKGFRQLFVKDFIIIYRVDHIKKHVIIVTVRHMKSII